MKWYHSLSIQAIIIFAFITFLFILGTVLIINTTGKKLVSLESAKVIEEMGNHAVSHISTRSTEIATLTRTLAATTETLPKLDASFERMIPSLVDFQGDLDIAGGGVWPEPYTFKADIEKRSFFWGRDSKGVLQYDGYFNTSSTGYHHEEWYVAVRHAKPGTCSWSEAYIYFSQPMVTCTVATFDPKGKFSGTVTIDLKLDGLQGETDDLQKQTGGYVFLLDRNNKFITFPDLALVKNITIDAQGTPTEAFLFASELAQKHPLFSPLSKTFTAMNQDILKQASQLAAYDPKIAEYIEHDSYQVDHEKAQLLSAVMLNPFENRTTKLYQTIPLSNDFILKQASTAFIFHIPDSYWKLVIVKPNTDIYAVATNLSHVMMGYMIMMAVIILGLVYFVFLKTVALPLSTLSRATQQLGSGDITAYDQQNISIRQDEVGEIGRATYDLTHYIKTVIEDIVHVSQGISDNNVHIRPQITYKGAFIQIEQAILDLVDATKENAAQDWMKTGHALLNEVLSGEHSMETLTKNIISFLTTYVNAHIGLFYIEQSSTFQVIARYGDTTENQTTSFQFGEGLVGQAAKEQKMICRTYTEQEWQFIIQSGCAKAVPFQVILVPIHYEHSIIGVIELGVSKDILTDLQKIFLEQAMLRIGIAVNITAQLIKEKG